MENGPLTVAELFAGVGGFRLGLEGAPSKEWETDLLKVEDTGFKVVFSNQWEPPGAKAASKSRKKRRGTKRRCNALTLKGQQCKKEEYGVPEGGFCRLHRDMNREGVQWASDIYVARFGPEGHSNEDIHDIALKKGRLVETIQECVPDHDLLVGGFPCQDYSVARTRSGELGIKGEKGKLWVPIRNIIDHARDSEGKRAAKIVLLENVPRLLNSPAKARGRNFALILHELLEMSYHVEWRVINAADYGMPQQRRRVFILAYRNSNYGTPDPNGKPNFGCLKAGNGGPMRKWLLNQTKSGGNPEWECGPFAEAFPCKGELIDQPQFLPYDLDVLSEKDSPFSNAGYAWKKKTHTMPDGLRVTDVKMFWTTKVKADYDGKRQTLGDVLVDEHDPDYEITSEDELYEWVYAKSEKKEFRIRKEDRERAEAVEVPEWERNLWEIYRMCLGDPDSGGWDDFRDLFTEHLGDICYKYEEGRIAYPDPLDRPSRTVVTSEIGRSPSRMRHLIRLDDGTPRRLMPIELERLNMFPDDWTKIDGIKDSRRGFLMGNALVVGVIERLRDPLHELMTERASG
jgi:DNA (cytosine-5)-methyltransferase 1